MTLFEQIKVDQLAARRSLQANKASLLTTLLADLARIEKDTGKAVPDEESIKKIKKYVENCDLILKHVPGDSNATFEKSVLEAYLPKQLSSDEISDIVAANDFPDLASFMKFMKSNHAGLYDGKLAKTIFESK